MRLDWHRRDFDEPVFVQGGMRLDWHRRDYDEPVCCSVVEKLAETAEHKILVGNNNNWLWLYAYCLFTYNDVLCRNTTKLPLDRLVNAVRHVISIYSLIHSHCSNARQLIFCSLTLISLAWRLLVLVVTPRCLACMFSMHASLHAFLVFYFCVKHLRTETFYFIFFILLFLWFSASTWITVS